MTRFKKFGEMCIMKNLCVDFKNVNDKISLSFNFMYYRILKTFFVDLIWFIIYFKITKSTFQMPHHKNERQKK